MENLIYTLQNCFTHKDFLVHDRLVGTLFSPLHFILSALLLALIIFLAIKLRGCSRRTVRNLMAVLWAIMVVWEVVKIVWETVGGHEIALEWGGVLPLYPCSIFLYAMPFALWGNEYMQKAACGYLSTLGLIGASINFFYPITVLPNYSILSFAGAHTMLFHGVMMFCFILMQTTGYHRYTHLHKPWELILPAIPTLIMSIPANIVNYSPIGSDYMFFKCNSFFLPSLFGWLADWQSTVILYVLYMLLPLAFYLPGMLYTRHKQKRLHMGRTN
ncbi:MAG: YwaF family protein [Clostridia bacterium]|nr:YwaF family protein [Clostridia bacterium]